MPASYDDIRTTLSRGFSVDNLRTITNLSLEILRQKPTYPAILLTIAAISRWVADAWDDVGPPGIPFGRVERQLKPHFVALLDLAEADSADVFRALNQAALAFDEAIRQGLDSDLSSGTQI